MLVNEVEVEPGSADVPVGFIVPIPFDPVLDHHR